MSFFFRRPIKVIGAGRTDSGVHALHMVVHFDFENTLPKDTINRLNAFLPKDIALYKIEEVVIDAHARFDALSRSYEYHITSQKNVFLYNYAYYYPYKLDVKAMNIALQLLLEHKHFSCFSKSNTDAKTDYCKISSTYWEYKKDKLIFSITADRFLRNMVRAIVGTLLEIGRGKQNEKWLSEVLKSKNRSEAGVSVPAQGLYLTKIKYPNNLFV